MTRHALKFTLVLCLGLAACGTGKNNSSWSTAKEGDPIIPALPSAVNLDYGADATATAAQAVESGTTTTGPSGKGVGPVTSVDIASLDAGKAALGAQLFPTKCSACHKMEERYIGPALAGVTKRREPEWILNMILNPENMIQKDPTAKALLAQYLAPMANQQLRRDEAESILAYFLQYDAGQGAATEAATPAGSEPAKTINQ